MKKQLALLALCCLLFSCTKENDPQPTPDTPQPPEPAEEPNMVGSYDVTTTCKIFLTDKVPSPITPDSLEIPALPQNLIVTALNDSTVTISYQDTLQEPFSAKKESATRISYKASIKMSVMNIVTLDGSRNGTGVLSDDSETLTMEEAIEGTFFGSIPGPSPIVLDGTFTGTLKHVATKTK